MKPLNTIEKGLAHLARLTERQFRDREEPESLKHARDRKRAEAPAQAYERKTFQLLFGMIHFQKANRRRPERAELLSFTNNLLVEAGESAELTERDLRRALKANIGPLLPLFNLTENHVTEALRTIGLKAGLARKTRSDKGKVS